MKIRKDFRALKANYFTTHIKKVGGNLLTAKIANGRLISLADSYERSELELLRKKETFYCPSCHDPVILKLGSKKIWHFAHVTNPLCKFASEHETPYHLHGKLQLYNWLTAQRIPTLLEPYLPSIKQRPDLLVKGTPHHYAIEYQCASIPLHIVRRRTSGYLRKGIVPIWIFGGKRVKRVSQNVYIVHNLEWSAIRKLDYPLIIYYCSERKQFLYVAPTFSISSNKIYGNASYCSPKSHSFSSLLDASSTVTIKRSSLLAIKRQWRVSSIRYPSKLQLFIHQLLQRQQRTIHLFPVEAGWPTKYHYLIESPTYLWQTWILLGFLQFKPSSEPFSLDIVTSSFRPLLGGSLVTLRSLSYFSENVQLAIGGYFEFLNTIGVVKMENQKIRKVKELELPPNLEVALLHEKNICETFY